MHRAIATTALVAATLIAPSPRTADAAPVRLVEAVGFRVEVRPMVVVAGEAGALEARRFEIPPGETGVLRFELPLPDDGGSAEIELTASGRSNGPDEEIRLELQASVTLPDGRVVRGQRSLFQQKIPA